jgi:hypothetical protein
MLVVMFKSNEKGGSIYLKTWIEESCQSAVCKMRFWQKKKRKKGNSFKSQNKALPKDTV